MGFRRFADAPPPPTYPTHHPPSGATTSDPPHDGRGRGSRSHSAEPFGQSKQQQQQAGSASYAMSTAASQQRLVTRSQSPAAGTG